MLFDDSTVEDAVVAAAGGQGAQKTAERAFTQAMAGFPLFGQILAPYGPSRKVAAQGMGMMYPYIGEAGQEQFNRTGLYAGAMKDTMILCWLCVLPDADKLPGNLPQEDMAKIWTPSRAIARPFEALDQAMAWGVEKGLIDVESKAFDEAYGVFMAIVGGISATEFAVKIAEQKAATSGLPPEEVAAPKP